jgi:UDP-sugar diphosphatase
MTKKQLSSKKNILSDVTVTDAGGLDYARLKQMHFTLNGRTRSWNIVDMHDSVAVLMYETDTRCFILVRQFRPPVYLHNNDGFTYELCAGLVDKEEPMKAIVREEILEETGYVVDTQDIREVSSFYTSVGKSGARQYLFYVEVTRSQRTHPGGGIDSEDIEVIRLPVADIDDFLYDEALAKTPGLMFAFIWWKEMRQRQKNRETGTST